MLCGRSGPAQDNASGGNSIANVYVARQKIICKGDLEVDCQTRLNNIEELTPGAGVTVAGLLIKNGVTDTNAVSLQNVPIDDTTPVTGQLLQYNGTEWAPTTLSGDVSGQVNATVVNAIQNIPIDNAVPVLNDVLQYNGSEWAPGVVSSVSLDPANPVYYGTGTFTANGGSNTVTIGAGASTIGPTNGTVVGALSSILGNNSVSVGYNTKSLGTNVVVLGSNSGSASLPSTNTIVGCNVAQNLITGTSNTAIGFSAMQNTVTCSINTAVGAFALSTSNNGNNVAVGYSAGRFLTGSSNVLLGAFSGQITAFSNNNIGIGSGVFNTSANINDNIAIGHNTLANCNSNQNVGIGYGVLQNLNTGNGHTAIGYRSGAEVQTGTNCTYVGYQSGNRASGSNNTALGHNTLAALGTNTNCIVIGAGATPSTTSVANQITLGNSSITTLRCATTTITAISDARDKMDVVPLDVGLDFINELKPVMFTWNMRDSDRPHDRDIGFIAQDLQSVPTIPGLVYEDNPDRLEIAQLKLIPILVKAVQQLSQENKILQSQINNLN